MFLVNNKQYQCPIELTLQTIMGKWKAVILWHLQDGKQRYGELKKTLPGINHKMLTQQLRELEEDGIITRTVYQVVPPKVEYELSELGMQIRGILESMRVFGMMYFNHNKGTISCLNVPANEHVKPTAMNSYDLTPLEAIL